MTLTHLSIPISASSSTSAPRSSGVHLSGIIKKLAVAQGIYPSPTPGAILPPRRHREIKMIIGLAWEDWLAPRLATQFPDFEYHLGEFELDGIYGTPDAIHIDPETGRLILHEIKATYYSSKQLTEFSPTGKLSPWLWQTLGYLAMLSVAYSAPCTTVILHPNFLCGNYTGGMNPDYLPVQFDFTRDEIMTNWELMLANKHLAEPEVYAVNGVDGNGGGGE
jgi:hypothetical protein